jgi:hypothetical protein
MTEKLDVNLERFLKANIEDLRCRLEPYLKMYMERKIYRKEILEVVCDRICHMLDMIDAKKIKP